MLGNLLPYEAMEKLVFAFEEVLKQHGIQIASGSNLERTCLAVLDILAKKRLPNLHRPMTDIRKYFAEVVGLWVFMNKLVRLQGHAGFKELVPHLSLLNSGNVPQNVHSPISDQASNKIFELLLALICLETGSDLELDNPHASRGNNPDVLSTILGKRWGFACKTLHSSSSKTLFDRVCEGVDQIERSHAEVGCVVLNFKNLIDHDHAWPILNEAEVAKGAVPTFGCWTDPALVGQQLAKLALKKQEEVETTIGKNPIKETFIGKKAIPAMLVYLQTATGVAGKIGPIPSSVGALFLCRFADVSEHLVVFEQLNSALHRMG